MITGRWLTFWAFLAAAGCGGIPPADQGGAPPQLELSGVSFRFFRGSVLSAVGTAEVATFRQDTGDLEARRAHVRLLDAQQTGPSHLFAEVSRGNLRTRRGVAEGGVTARDQSGSQAVTERCEVDGRARTAQGDKPVEISGDGFRMSGPAGFTMDLAQGGALVLNGPVQTVLGGGAP